MSQCPWTQGHKLANEDHYRTFQQTGGGLSKREELAKEAVEESQSPMEKEHDEEQVEEDGEKVIEELHKAAFDAAGEVWAFCQRNSREPQRVLYVHRILEN